MEHGIAVDGAVPGAVESVACQILRRAALRATDHRRAILHIFLGEPEARRTAQDLAQQLQQQQHANWFGTVYRVMHVFVQRGILEKSWSAAGRHVYWLKDGPHGRVHRFVCRGCQRGFSTCDPELERMVQRLCTEQGVALPDQALQVQALCARCAR